MVNTVSANSLQNLWQLPSGWSWVKLSDVLTIKYGKSLRANQRVSSGQYPVFGSGGKLGFHDTAFTNYPVIVIGRKGSIGAIFLSEQPCWAIDTTYYVDEFSSLIYSIYPKYVYFFLKIIGLENLNRAAAIPGLNRDDIYSFSLPIPFVENPSYSLEIQRRVVERIEALLSEVKASRNLLAEMRQDTEQVINVALEEVVQSFPSARKTLSDVLDLKPRNGWSPKCDNNPDGVPVLKLGAVLGFRYNPDQIKRTSLPVAPNAHYWLQPGDLLISRSNTPELVGHAAIYSGNPFPCIYPDLLMRMTVDELKADSQFVIYWLQTAEVREYVQTHASGVSSTMKKITKTDVCNIPFPKISLREQNQFTLYLNSIQQETEAMLKMLERDAQSLDQLERSILERAFRRES
jgi:type I restriction enzyme S subunit